MSQPLFTFEQQRALFKLVREIEESAADVAVHPGRETQAGQRARLRKEKAHAALSSFMSKFVEQPGKVAS
jgi:hypothetical protein